MKILYMPIFESGARHERQKLNKHGLRDALAKYGEVWEWDYSNHHERSDVYHETRRKLDHFQPDMLFTQLHGPDWITPDQMAEIRRDYPALIIVNWNGDYWPHSLTSPAMLDLLKHIDLQLMVNGSVLDDYEENGISAAFWPFGFETPVTDLPEMPAHDVVYLGSNYSEKRAELGRILRSLPHNVGIYGDGWADAQGENLYDFAAGHALYQNAKIAISDNQFPNARGYLSNRPFQALAAGAFLLQQTVKHLEPLTGLTDGTHYVEFTELDEIPDLVESWLKKGNAARRRKIAKAGQEFVLEHHSFDERVRYLFDVLLPRVRP